MPDPGPPYTTVIVRSQDLDVDQTIYFNGLIPPARCIECATIFVDMRYENISAYLQNNVLAMQISDGSVSETILLTFPDGFYTIGTAGTTNSYPNSNGVNFWNILAGAVSTALTAASLSGCTITAGLDQSSLRGYVGVTNNSGSSLTIGFAPVTDFNLLGFKCNALSVPSSAPNSKSYNSVTIPTGTSGTWFSPGYPSSNTIEGVDLVISDISANNFNTIRPVLKPVLKSVPTLNSFGTTVVDSLSSNYWLNESRSINSLGIQLLTDKGFLCPSTITYQAELRLYT